MGASDDMRLVELAIEGDAAAYGELFERYNGRIFNYAYGIAGNPEDAKDITQDAFMRVFEALPGKDPSLNFSAYLYRTTHNMACDALKARKRFVGPDALDLEREPALRADPERVALLKEQQTQARAAAFSLPDEQRAVLMLRELQEMSYQEIADVLEMPRNTVGVYLSRARLGFKGAFRMTAVDVEKCAEECERMLPLLSAYLDDELDAAERRRVEDHLEACAFCALALGEMTEASRSYRSLIPILAPPDIAEAVMRDVSKLTEQAAPAPRSFRPRARLGQLVSAAGLALVLVLGAAWLGEQPPAETEPLLPVAVSERVGSRVANSPFAPNADRSTGETKEIEVAEEPPAEEEESPPPPAQVPAATEPTVPAAPPDTTPPPTPLQISPADGYESPTPGLTLTWEAVEDPSGVTYGLEVQDWDGYNWMPFKTLVGLGSPSVGWSMTNYEQRWRVWATDGAGNTSEPSPWRRIEHSFL